MESTTAVLLLFLSLGCLILHANGQLCGNTRSCTSGCNADPGSCCLWEDQPIQTDPESLIRRGATPLGFISYSLPGLDSEDPAPCVRVQFPESAVGQINYLVFAIETLSTNICVQQVGSQAEPTCGNYFCMMVNIVDAVRFVDLNIFCPSSCESDYTSFFMKAVISSADRDIEDFCDTNSTIPLPSSLRTVTNVPNMPVTTFPTLGAPALAPLSVLTLLTLSAVMVKLFSL